MKLKQACEIARECGCTTVGGAILFAELHSMSLFTLDEIEAEIKELYKEFKNSSLDEDTPIDEILEDYSCKKN